MWQRRRRVLLYIEHPFAQAPEHAMQRRDDESLCKRDDVGLRSWRNRFNQLHPTHTLFGSMHWPAYTSHVATQEAFFAIH